MFFTSAECVITFYMVLIFWCTVLPSKWSFEFFLSTWLWNTPLRDNIPLYCIKKKSTDITFTYRCLFLLRLLRLATATRNPLGWKGALEIISSNTLMKLGRPEQADQHCVQSGYEHLHKWTSRPTPPWPLGSSCHCLTTLGANNFVLVLS